MTLGVFLLAFLTAQRLGELAWSARNISRGLAAGGIEFGCGHYPLLVTLGATMSNIKKCAFQPILVGRK